MLNLGINTNHECGSNYIEILQNIKAANFTDVMVAAKVGDFEDTIRKALELKLNIPYVHLSTSHINDTWTRGESNEEIINNIINEIEICGKYKIKIAVMHIASGNPANIPLSPNEQGLASINKILKVAKKHNVKIAIENIDLFSFKNFKYILDNISDPYLGFCYDVGHHHLYNANFDILKEYGNRLLAVHLHDNLMDWEEGYDYTRDLHRLPFDGKIDFNKVISKLAVTPYNNTIMLELHKDSCGSPKLYENISSLELLKEAYKRAEKLGQILNEYRSKS